jgi:hypothetical protein
LDLRLDQEYLRSQPVNSEEGAPMGIGIWYEMWVDDPVAFLFKNTDPRGSLRANLSNATVRCLSNMPLAEMLQTRHNMSQTVRQEVTSKSQEWGYQLGSVYIRKVHFRDVGMIRQHPPRHAGAGVPGDRPRAGGGRNAVRDSGGAEDSGGKGAHCAAAGRAALEDAGEPAGGGRRRSGGGGTGKGVKGRRAGHVADH